MKKLNEFKQVIDNQADIIEDNHNRIVRLERGIIAFFVLSNLAWAWILLS